MRNIRVLIFVAAAASLAGCAAAGGSHGSDGRHAGQSGPWHVKLTYFPADPGLIFPEQVMVAAPSPADAWMIGAAVASSGKVSDFADRWDGTAWKRLALPRRVAKLMAGESDWTALSASSRNNVWLFGQTTAEQSGRGPETYLWLHYRHGHVRWGTVRVKGTANVSYALATGSGSVWVFGYPEGQVVYVWHYEHGKWARHRLPSPKARVVSAAAGPGGDIWAVETYHPYALQGADGALLHYSAGRWKHISLPASMRGAVVTGVVPCGTDCAWISGGTANSKGGITEAIARWDASRWYIAAPPVPTSRRNLFFPGILSDGRGGLWAYGYASLSPQKAQLWHFAKNTWIKQTFGKQAEVGQPLALIPGATSFWAIGAASAGTRRARLPRTALALVTHSRGS